MQPLLLIIDDEEDILDLLSYNFSKEGYIVKAFDRGEAAIEFLGQHRPDMILCDWMMPGLSGIELCKMIKGNLDLADIPFVMVTCRSEKAAMRQAMAEGVTDFIVKPVRIQDLIDRIKGLLQEKAA